MAGCTTSSIDDMAPSATSSTFPAAPRAADADPLQNPTMGGAIDDDIANRNVAGAPADAGQYPNLNIAPKSAAPIPSAEDVAAKKAALRARQQAVASTVPGKPPYDAAKLKKLASTHADEALKEIEGQ